MKARTHWPTFVDWTQCFIHHEPVTETINSASETEVESGAVSLQPSLQPQVSPPGGY